jgi:hypothetical protein
MITYGPESRYWRAPVVQITDHNGEQHPSVMARNVIQAVPRFRYATTRAGDRLDALAGVVGFPSTQWWRLAEMNPEYFFPEVPPGRVIRLPAV